MVLKLAVDGAVEGFVALAAEEDEIVGVGCELGVGSLPAGLRGFGGCHVRDSGWIAEVGGLLGVEEEVESGFEAIPASRDLSRT